MAHVSTPVSAAAGQADMPKQHFALASLTTLFLCGDSSPVLMTY